MRPSRRAQAGTGTPVRPERARGQSLVEFAISVPILLLIVLIIGDFARLYSAWLTLQSTTRDAAEAAAASAPYSVISGTPEDAARAVFLATFCAGAATIPGYSAGASSTTCTGPGLGTVSGQFPNRTCNQAPTAFAFSDNAGLPGGSPSHKVAVVTADTCFTYQPLFPFFAPADRFVLSAHHVVNLIEGRLGP